MYWYFYAKVLEKRIIYNSHTIINGIADGIKIKKIYKTYQKSRWQYNTSIFLDIIFDQNFSSPYSVVKFKRVITNIYISLLFLILVYVKNTVA
jgi:hypothetical protein